MPTDNITISTDTSKLNVEYMNQFLSETYWAKGRTLDEMRIMIANSSLNFGMYDGNKQIGYARVLTDTLRFAYILDVFIDKDYQGKGLGQHLVKTILEHESMVNVDKIALGTKDAHGVYAKLGFKPLEKPEIWMERVKVGLVC